MLDSSSCQLHGEFTFNPTFSGESVRNIFSASDNSFCPELIRAVEGVRYINDIRIWLMAIRLARDGQRMV